MSPHWESQEGTIDIAEYNRSLRREPERTALRQEVTSTKLRRRVLDEIAKMNGEAKAGEISWPKH